MGCTDQCLLEFEEDADGLLYWNPLGLRDIAIQNL